MNSDQGSVADLVAYITSYARSYLEEHSLAVELHAPGPWPDVQLSSEQRRNLFLVVKECLHNTVKHARANKVELGIAMVDGQVRLTIADDGIGIPADDKAPTGNGLRNIRSRIDRLGGTIGYMEGPGTRILINVPIADTNKGSIAAALPAGQLRTHGQA
jgi:signal transduction histidine kinase